MKLLLVSSGEEPPSSKRVSTMEDEGVEQLQSAVLHSASPETATMGEGVGKMYIVCCVCTCAAIIIIIIPYSRKFLRVQFCGWSNFTISQV